MTEQRIAHLVQTFEVAMQYEKRARRVHRRTRRDRDLMLLHLAEDVTRRAAVRLSNAVARAVRSKAT